CRRRASARLRARPLPAPGARRRSARSARRAPQPSIRTARRTRWSIRRRLRSAGAARHRQSRAARTTPRRPRGFRRQSASSSAGEARDRIYRAALEKANVRFLIREHQMILTGYSQGRATSGRLKVATWNVNGIRAREAQLLDWLDREKPDVVCLQETKAAPEQLPASLSTLGGYHCAWHGRKGYSGVALLLASAKYPPPDFAYPVFDIENRIVSASHDTLVFASVYVPNGGKDFVAKMQFL